MTTLHPSKFAYGLPRLSSPEIKARQALFAFLPVYPELVGILGKSTVPDYRGIFLRGYGAQTSYPTVLLGTGVLV